MLQTNVDQKQIQWLKYELQARELDLEVQCQAMQEALGDLEESRNRYAALYDSAPVGYVTFDDKGCIQEINLTGARLLGVERGRLYGMPMSTFVDKNNYKLFFDHLRFCRDSEERVVTELQLATRDATVIHVQLISSPLLTANVNHLQYRTVITDITERKLMEKGMSRLEGLHLIGEMAAGIAHEIRNPMTTVRGFLQSFTRKTEFVPFHSQLELMMTELDRANAIITEFLSLAKDKAIDQSLQNLNAIIENLLPLLESDALMKEKWIVSELGENIPALFIDQQEIRQLILNIVNNGLESMSPGGYLTIRTFVKQQEVILAISDQGAGIPVQVLEHLGTPFLTTKEKGTGLGLAICYSIADRHNAKIDVKTGKAGTTFMVKFLLPA